VYLIKSAFFDKKVLRLSKCTVKQQLKSRTVFAAGQSGGEAALHKGIRK
jgi:hypothetical protein